MWKEILKQNSPKELFDLVDFPTDDSHLYMWDNIPNSDKYLDVLERAEMDNHQYEKYFDIWYVPNSNQLYNDKGLMLQDLLYELKREYYTLGKPTIFEGVNMDNIKRDENGFIDYEGWDEFAELIWQDYVENKHYSDIPTLVAAPLDAKIGDDKRGTLIAGFHRAAYNWEKKENKVVYFKPKKEE